MAEGASDLARLDWPSGLGRLRRVSRSEFRSRWPYYGSPASKREAGIFKLLCVCSLQTQLNITLGKKLSRRVVRCYSSPCPFGHITIGGIVLAIVDQKLRWDEKIVMRVATWMTRHVQLALFVMVSLFLAMLALVFGGSS